MHMSLLPSAGLLENVCAGQILQSLGWLPPIANPEASEARESEASNHFPASQSMQSSDVELPTCVEYFPTPHRMQPLSPELPMLSTYLPATHAMQASVACVEYWPTSQGVQVLAPDERGGFGPATDPGLQLIQSPLLILPVLITYLPAPHS